MTRPLDFAKNFRSFAELAIAYFEGADYLIARVPRLGSTVGIVALHGRCIEVKHLGDYL